MKNYTFKAILFFFSILLANSISAQEIDTTGMSEWTPLYNSELDWENGAFSRTQTGHPDYGWGVYSMVTHNLKGDSIYIIKTHSGEYKKLVIENKMSMQNIYNFRYANLDGSDEKIVELSCGDYTAKNHVAYSLDDNAIVDREPNADAWEILFTRYYSEEIVYFVTGILSNFGVTVSELEAADSTTAALSTIADTTEFSENINVIGSDWKSFSQTTFQYSVHDNKVYFVKLTNGDIYKLIFNGFDGSSTGNVNFTVEFNGESKSVEVSMGAGYADDVYYSLANESATVVPRATWDIAFHTNVMSSSIITNVGAGVELYVYPHADINAWINSGIEDFTGSESNYLVFPNPSNNLLNILPRNPLSANATIEMFDILGNRVMYRSARKLGNSLSINLEEIGLQSGTYFLRITEQGKVHSQKIVFSK